MIKEPNATYMTPLPPWVKDTDDQDPTASNGSHTRTHQVIDETSETCRCRRQFLVSDTMCSKIGRYLHLNKLKHYGCDYRYMLSVDAFAVNVHISSMLRSSGSSLTQISGRSTILSLLSSPSLAGCRTGRP